MEFTTGASVALLDAIGAVIIGAFLTFFVTQHFLKPPAAAVPTAASAESASAKAPVPAPASSTAGGAAKDDDDATPKNAAALGFGNFDADNTLALIKTRRSIFPKDFDELSAETTVPRESLELLFEAANWAPCHGKNEPWRFVVVSAGKGFAELTAVREQVTRDLFHDKPEKMEMQLAKLKKKSKGLARCSHVIFICVKRVPGKKGKLMPEWEDQAAVACAVQNLHLMATALGVAGYWSSGGVDTMYMHDKFRAFLGLGEDARCYGNFVVGSSRKAASYRASRGPAAEKVTWIGE